MPQPVDDDRTIRLTKPVASIARPPRVPLWATAGSLAGVVVVVAGAWLLWPSPAPAPSAAKPEAAQGVPPPRIAAAPTAAVGPPKAPTAPAPKVEAIVAPAAVAPPLPAPSASPEFSIQTATEQQILDHVAPAGAPDPTVFNFAPNPRILVLDFASLLGQGRMLNRVAALAEKSGLPHDRLLNDIELDTAIRSNGDTVETFYYGHDYGSPELIRFFALADRDNIRLMGDEDRLGRLIRQAGWFGPEVHAALISIPQVGADEHVTRLARTTILHHELSHGEYFTNPAYAAFVHRFWTQTLTTAERDQIRRHLHLLGYDASLEEVMENEAQAYLIFTDDTDFFAPGMIDMGKPRLAELRAGFYRTMPAGWLRDSLGQTLGVNKAVVTHP
jgi:hypothetical protein